MSKLGRIALFIWIIILVRSLYGQGNSINSHIFTVTPTPDRTTLGRLNFRDLQATPFVGGWTAPNTWAANNLIWKMPTNDFEGCLTSNGSLATAWNNCVHEVSKNFDCVAASASGLHYTCSTLNTFTPATGDAVFFKADVANSASPDLAVNGAGAKPLVVGSTVVALTANAMAAGSWSVAIYDGTNWQVFVGATFAAHGMSGAFDCAAASASGLHYTCTTAPSFTPATGDAVLFKADVTNSASADLAVNGASAKPIVSNMSLAAITATTLSAGSWTWCVYDGTNWQCALGGTGGGTTLHVITFGADGCGNGATCSVVSTGDLGRYPSADFSCTINGGAISADQSGSVTIDIWKVNAAIPTSANKISASAPVTLSSSQLNQAISLAGWTTSVVAKDVFGFNITSASVMFKFTAQLWCQ